MIIEKTTHPRYKACAGGIPALIEKLLPFSLSCVLERRLRVITIDWGIKNMDIEFKKPVIFTVERDKFDRMLFEKAKKKSDIVYDRVVECGNSWVKTEKSLYKGRIIVGADGAGSVVRKSFGLSHSGRWVKTKEVECEGEMERVVIRVFPLGYAWIFPKKGRFSAGAGGIKGFNLEYAFMEMERRYGPFKKIREEHWSYPVYGRRRDILKGNVLLVGDAGCFANPLTGAGIYTGVVSSYVAARSIDDYLERNIPLSSYPLMIKKIMERELISSLYLAPLFYFFPYIPLVAGRRKIKELWGKGDCYYKIFRSLWRCL